jgi:hypothetical protein
MKLVNCTGKFVRPISIRWNPVDKEIAQSKYILNDILPIRIIKTLTHNQKALLEMV